MNAWTPLTSQDYGDVWDRFQRQFHFRPSYPADGPGIQEPIPSVTFAMSAPVDTNIFQGSFTLIVDLHIKANVAFQRVTPVGKSIIVLNWQHDEYIFDPHAPFNVADWREWKTWVYPDGDYYIFLAEDFSYGTFGHPWADTICVWGQPLIDAFAADPPLLFGRVVRRNGVAVDEM